MDAVKQKIFYSNLLSIYGEMLSSTQKDILIDYYNFDLSISEIALNREVSRSAIEDAIKKGTKKLQEYENKLKVYQIKNNISSLLNEWKENPKNSEEIIKKIEEELK